MPEPILTPADRALIDAEGGRFNRKSMYATVEGIVAEHTAALRDTNDRLNRRAQAAESAINELTTGTGNGKLRPLAREMWERCQTTHERGCNRAEAAEAERDRLREGIEALIAAPDDTQWWEVVPYMDPPEQDEVVEVAVVASDRLRALLDGEA